MQGAEVKYREKRVLVIPDMHAPYHDKTVWKTILRALDCLEDGDEIVFIGDFADYYRVSRYFKDADRMDFEKELAVVNKMLDKVQEFSYERDVDVTFLEGNHENRLARYVQEHAPDIHSIVPGTNELLYITDRDWKFFQYTEVYKVGKMSFVHDVGRAGKNADKQSLVDFGGNLCFGHTHRGSVVYMGTTRGEQHVCLNVGWGGDVSSLDYKPKHKALREWQHGFGIVDFDSRGNCYAQFIPIVNKKCFVDGIQY